LAGWPPVCIWNGQQSLEIFCCKHNTFDCFQTKEVFALIHIQCLHRSTIVLAVCVLCLKICNGLLCRQGSSWHCTMLSGSGRGGEWDLVTA
jgi:hypothetical protein